MSDHNAVQQLAAELLLAEFNIRQTPPPGARTDEEVADWDEKIEAAVRSGRQTFVNVQEGEQQGDDQNRAPGGQELETPDSPSRAQEQVEGQVEDFAREQEQDPDNQQEENWRQGHAQGVEEPEQKLGQTQRYEQDEKQSDFETSDQEDQQKQEQSQEQAFEQERIDYDEGDQPHQEQEGAEASEEHLREGEREETGDRLEEAFGTGEAEHNSDDLEEQERDADHANSPQADVVALPRPAAVIRLDEPQGEPTGVQWELVEEEEDDEEEEEYEEEEEADAEAEPESELDRAVQERQRHKRSDIPAVEVPRTRHVRGLVRRAVESGLDGQSVKRVSSDAMPLLERVIQTRVLIRDLTLLALHVDAAVVSGTSHVGRLVMLLGGMDATKGPESEDGGESLGGRIRSVDGFWYPTTQPQALFGPVAVPDQDDALAKTSALREHARVRKEQKKKLKKKKKKIQRVRGRVGAARLR